MSSREVTRELQGMAALVTGSTGILGAAIAKSIAKAGASVLVNAKTSGNAAKEVVNEISKKGGNAIYII